MKQKFLMEAVYKLICKISFTCTLLIAAHNVNGQTNSFPASGNVGIGTTSPTSILTVQGVAANNVFSLLRSNGYPMLLVNTYSGAAFQDIYKSDGTTVAIHLNSNGNTYFNNGNIGIGTSVPSEKLSVKGKIRAQEIKVELAGWADFVFAKDYVLPTLQETEQHIKEKGHLPGIPSAAEVEKHGVELGEMNRKLLQKIEELTLYLIKQQKELDELKLRFKPE